MKYARADSGIMVKITPEMKEVFSKVKPYYLATASKDGVPNVAPMGMVILQDDMETVWIVDNYMCKTLANLKENPRASMDIWDPDTPESYQLKFSATVEDSGADYEKAVAFAHAKSEKYPAKSLVKLKVEEVYSVTPGPGAGRKLL